MDAPESAPESGVQPQTKLDEQATAKGVYSYSYFAAQTSNGVLVAPPRKLTDEEAAAQQELERQRNAQGVSSWNAANTFEERSWTEWAKERLPALATASSADKLVVEGVTDVAGHANTWIVRGKKRHGFDLAFTVSWSWAGPVQVKGTAKVPSGASDDLDDEEVFVELPEVTTKAPANAAHEAAACKAAAAALPKLLTTALQQLLQELKQK